MATIGTLAVNIQARTGQFRTGIGRVRKDIGGLQKSAGPLQGTIGGLIGKFGGLAAGALGAAAAIRGLANAASLLDTAAKKGALLGIDPQRLLELKFAGEQTGVAFNTMTTSLQRFGRRVSEAANGTGEARGAIKELGLDAAKLEQMGLDRSFLAVADAIQQVQNPLDKVRIAQKLFDRGGVDLVNTLNLGSTGINKLSKEYRGLAGQLSKTDFRNVEAMNDSINGLKKSFAGLFQQVLAGIAPFVTALVKGLTFIIKIISTLVGWVVKAIKWIGKLFGLGVKEEAQTKKTTKAIRQKVEETKKLTEAQQQAIDEQKRLNQQGEQIRKQFRTPVETFREKIADLNKLVNVGAIGWTTYGRAIEGVTKDLRQAVEQEKRANAANANREGVAAVTRGSAAAFSASQEDRRRHRERLEEEKKQTNIQQEMLAEMRKAGVQEPIKVVQNRL